LTNAQLTGLPSTSYEFDTYKKHSLTFYTILMAYADELEAVSVDEALIDVTSRVNTLAQAPLEFDASEGTKEPAEQPARDHVKLLAEKIRDDMRKATGCEGKRCELLAPAIRSFFLCPPSSQHRCFAQYSPC
jgi:nucleotidyltransferase/DNA polymerase involved in DNA repair